MITIEPWLVLGLLILGAGAFLRLMAVARAAIVEAALEAEALAQQAPEDGAQAGNFMPVAMEV